MTKDERLAACAESLHIRMKRHIPEDLMDVTHEAPITKLVDVITTPAPRRQAGDIHIENSEQEIETCRIVRILYDAFSEKARDGIHACGAVTGGVEKGMQTLFRDAPKKAVNGATSLNEMLRVAREH